MRILFVVLSPLSAELGASQMALNLSAALRALGSDVVVWTPQPVPSEIPWWRRVDWMRRRIAEYVGQDGSFDLVDVPPVAVTAALARQCTVIARSVQPDLIYLWTEVLRDRGTRSASLLRRIAGMVFSLYVAALVVLGWHRATRILCLGSAELEWMTRWFPWWRRKLRVYVNAIGDDERRKLAQIRTHRKAPPAGQGLRFLWLGRWAAHKGVDLLLDFVLRRSVRFPSDRITIAGCGREAERDIPTSLLHDGKVRVVPSYSRDELFELLASHDAGLFTSHAEGWGLTLQEMLESGMPVYATAAGAVRDLQARFPDQLRKFPPSPPLATSVHAELPSVYLERFSWQAIGARYLEDMREKDSGDVGKARLCLLRMLAWLWRFRTLKLSARAFAHVTSPCIVRRRFRGYRLHLDVSRSSAQRLLYLEGERFVPESGLLQSLVAPGDVVVDVGANIGYYAMLFARAVGPAGRVVAFEPEPDNLIELRMNVERNALTNTDIRACAVGATEGTVAFARGINGSVQPQLASHPTGVIRVPMVTLDAAVAGPVNVIKIDVEGYEGAVLAGCRKTIERWRPSLFVEIHPALVAETHSVDGILSFLRRYYARIELYQPAKAQSLMKKIMARYTGYGSVESLPAWENATARRRDAEQDTFWAICRTERRN